MLGRRPGLRGNLAPYAALALLNVIGCSPPPCWARPSTTARLVGALTAFVGVAVVSLHPDCAVTTVGIALGVAAAVSG